MYDFAESCVRLKTPQMFILYNTVVFSKLGPPIISCLIQIRELYKHRSNTGVTHEEKRTVRGVISIYEVLDVTCFFSRNTRKQVCQRIPEEKGRVETQPFS